MKIPETTSKFTHTAFLDSWHKVVLISTQQLFLQPQIQKMAREFTTWTFEMFKDLIAEAIQSFYFLFSPKNAII